MDKEKTFTCLRSCYAYTGLINLVSLLGGKNIDFALPFPIFDLVHVQTDHLILWIQMNSCFTKQLLPGN